MDVDVDVVPMGELFADDPARNWIVCHQVFDSLVRKYNAPAKRDAFRVPLENMNVVPWVAKFRRDREIKPRGSATDARNLQGLLSPP
jgi:hypothetical protein